MSLLELKSWEFVIGSEEEAMGYSIFKYRHKLKWNKTTNNQLNENVELWKGEKEKENL